MRRFEYRDDKSEKFWHIDVQGAEFTVSYGRIGTNGQSKTKTFSDADKAQAEAEKLIRQKTRKGYEEVGQGSAPTEPSSASMAPSADRAARGKDSESKSLGSQTRPSAERSTARPAPRPREASGTRFEEVFHWTARMRKLRFARPGQVEGIQKPKSLNKLWAEIRGCLADRAEALEGKDVFADPHLQAAVDEAFARSRQIEPPEGPASLQVEAATMILMDFLHYGGEFISTPRWPVVDFWLALGGFRTALSATIATEEARVQIKIPGIAEDYLASRKLEHGYLGAWLRLRERLAMAEDSVRLQAREIAAELRQEASPEVRIGLAFAFPDIPEWAEEEWRPELSPIHAAILACSTANAELVCSFGPTITEHWLVGFHRHERFSSDLSILEANGPEVLPVAVMRMRALGEDSEYAVGLAKVLARVRHPVAITALLEHSGAPKIADILSEALDRYPEEALSILVGQLDGESGRSDAARRWLTTLLARHADHLGPAIESLSDGERKLVNEVLDAVSTVPEAPADALPEILVRPPWLGQSSGLQIPFVEDLSLPDFEDSMQWRTGERVEWSCGGAVEANPDTYHNARFELPISPSQLQDMTPDEARDVIRRTAEKIEADHWLSIEILLSWPRHLISMFLQHYPPGVFGSEDTPCYQKLAADFGLEALPGLVASAMSSPARVLPSLGPYQSLRPAVAVATALSRKPVRASARAWIERQPLAAAVGLLHVAMAHADEKTRHFAAEGARLALRHTELQTVIDAGDVSWKQAVEGFVAVDPRFQHPEALPELPFFWRPEHFTRPQLKDGSGALPSSTLQHLGHMLAFSPPDLPYPGLVDTLEACDRDSLAGFAWDLFEAWKNAGMPAKENWVFTALSVFGNDETARRLTPLLKIWPGEGGHQRAVIGLDVLSLIGSDVALMHLNGIAQKVKFQGLRQRAREKIAEIAARRGLSQEELADRLVPDLGLDAGGTLELSFGSRSFRVGFDEQLKPFVRGDDGKQRANLPKPRKDDDPESAKAASARYKALKKDVRALAGLELIRLERAMCGQRRWRLEDFKQFLVEHPLLGHLVRRLVWGRYDAEGELLDAFRVAEDGSFADAGDEELVLSEGTLIGIAHPVELGAERLAAFGEILADYEILQPFPQLERKVSQLTAEERQAMVLTRWKGQDVPFGRVLKLEKLGWIRGAPQDGGYCYWYERPVNEQMRLYLYIEPGIRIGDVDAWEEQTVYVVEIDRPEYVPTGINDSNQSDSGIPFSALDDITISEMLRELEVLSETP